MDVELWKQLGLPLNLFIILNKKFSFLKASSGNSNVVNTALDKTEVKKNMIDDENYDTPTVLQDSKEYVFAYTNEIINEIRNFDIYVPILKNIHLVLSNILKNPKEEKFKKIKADSAFLKNYIFPYKSATNFFFWFNFKKCEIDNKLFYVWLGEISELTKNFDYYNDFLIDRNIIKIENKIFNPYSASLMTVSNEKKPDFSR